MLDIAGSVYVGRVRLLTVANRATHSLTWFRPVLHLCPAYELGHAAYHCRKFERLDQNFVASAINRATPGQPGEFPSR